MSTGRDLTPAPQRPRIRASEAARRGSNDLKKALAYCIIVFWVFMASLFVRNEVIPTIYAHPARGYAGIRAYAQTHAGYRMGVTTADGDRIGSAQTTYQLLDNGDCEIQSEAVIDFGSLVDQPPGGRAKETPWSKLVVHSNTTVGPDNALKQFRISCDTGVFRADSSGFVEGEELKVTVDVAGVKNKLSVPVTKDDVVSSGVMALGALPNLRVGQTWSIRMLSIPAFQFTNAYVTVKKKTTILLRGHRYPVFEVETRHDLGKVTTWVDASGNVLREQAFNLVFTREPLPHEMAGRPGETLTSPPARASERRE